MARAVEEDTSHSDQSVLRRGEGIVPLVLCNSPQTCNVPDGGGSLHPVVLRGEDLDATPRGLAGIRVVLSVEINEVDAAVDSAMRLTLRVEMAVRTPAVTDDRSVEFDPGVYDGR